MFDGTDELDPRNLSSRELLVVLFERVRTLSKSFDDWQGRHDEHTRDIAAIARTQEKQGQDIAGIETTLKETKGTVRNLEGAAASLHENALTADEAILVRVLNKRSLSRGALLQAHWHNIVFYVLGTSTLILTILNSTGHSVHIMSGHP